jgi:hypothetical protein
MKTRPGTSPGTTPRLSLILYSLLGIFCLRRYSFFGSSKRYLYYDDGYVTT